MGKERSGRHVPAQDSEVRGSSTVHHGVRQDPEAHVEGSVWPQDTRIRALLVVSDMRRLGKFKLRRRTCRLAAHGEVSVGIQKIRSA